MYNNEKNNAYSSPVRVDEEDCIGLSNEQISQMANELRQMREQENSGNPLTSQQARRRIEINTMIFQNDRFRNFAYPYIKESFPTYWQNHKDSKDELMDSALLEFFANLHKYNGTCQISTFAKVHLHHGAQLYISFFEKKGSYDNENWIKVSRCQAKLIGQHAYDSIEDIPIAKIAQETGLSTTQVSMALEVHNGSTHCDLDTGAANVATKQWVPENAIIQKESDKAVNDLLSVLPKVERYVFSAKTGLESDPLSFQEIGLLPEFISLLRKEDLPYLIKKGTIKVKSREVTGEYVPGKDVIDIYESAKAHLRQCSSIQSKFNTIRKKLGKEAAGITSYSKIVEQDEFAVMQLLDNPNAEIKINRN